MKATLEFNLPAEAEEFRTAQDGKKWKAFACELRAGLIRMQSDGNKDEIRYGRVFAFMNDLEDKHGIDISKRAG